MWESVWESLITGNVLEALILLVLSIIMMIVRIVLAPFGALIAIAIPQLDEFLSSVSTMLSSASTYLSWTFSLVGMPVSVITIITGYYLMVLTITIAVWIFKLGIFWHRAIK